MPADTEIRMIEMIFPAPAKQGGTLFGGRAPGLMAKAAFVAAARHAETLAAQACASPLSGGLAMVAVDAPGRPRPVGTEVS